MPLDLVAAYANANKGSPVAPTLSDERAVLTQQYSGRWYHASKQGRVFTGNSAAAGSVVINFDATAQVFGLWNPAGSGVNGVLISLRGTYKSVSPGAAGGYVWGITRNAGATIAAGGITVFTETSPERGLLGSLVGGNKIRFTASAATVIVPTAFVPIGVNQLVLTNTDATNLFNTAFQVNYDGDFILTPNTAIWFAGNISLLSAVATSVTWAEEPI